MADKDLRDLERYFRDPKLGDRVLEVGVASHVCKNIRLALRALGFHGEFGQIDFSENYDVTLARHILRFQEALKHTSRDGRFGPGTRRLLTRALHEQFGDSVFRRMTDPEQRGLGHIFVSYSRSDRARVLDAVHEIESWGFNVWFDGNISGGERWNASIQDKVQSCYLLLVFLSAQSVKSKWVQLEVMYAFQQSKDILPVKLDTLPSGHALEMVLLTRQMLDAPKDGSSPADEADFKCALKTAIQVAHRRQM